MSDTAHSALPNNQQVVEVRGWFSGSKPLEDATRRLQEAGFDHKRFTVLRRGNTDAAAATAPAAESPDTEDNTRQVRTLRSSTTAAAAAMAGAAAVVATGGAAAVAVAAAAGAGLVAGGGVFAADSAAGTADAASQDDAGAEGHLILAVAVGAGEDRTVVENALRQSGATDIEVVDGTQAPSRPTGGGI